MKVRLKSVHAFKANQTNNIVVVGDVTYDENSTIEVDESVVDELIHAMPEFSIVNDGMIESEPEKEKEKEVEKSIEKESDLKPQVEESDLGKSHDEESKISPQTEENDIFGSSSLTDTHVVSVSEIPLHNHTLAIETSEKDNSNKIEINTDELRSKLEEKSAKELKELVNQISEETGKELTNNKQRVDFLVNELSK